MDGRPRGGPGRHRPRGRPRPRRGRRRRPGRRAGRGVRGALRAAAAVPAQGAGPRAGRSRSRPTRAPSRPRPCGPPPATRSTSTTGPSPSCCWPSRRSRCSSACVRTAPSPSSPAACGCRGSPSSSRRPPSPTTRPTPCSGRCSRPPPTRSPDFAREVVAACVRLESRGGELGDAAAAVVRVAEEHPDDIGLVVLLLMHHRVLQPGEYIDVAAGVLHSYVRGLGIEVLANSDNVVRAGLTSKPVNVPELLRIVDPLADGVAGRGRVVEPGLETFDSASDRFRLYRVTPGRVLPGEHRPAHRVLPARPGDPHVGRAHPRPRRRRARRSSRRARARSTSRAPARSTSSPSPRPDLREPRVAEHPTGRPRPWPRAPPRGLRGAEGGQAFLVSAKMRAISSILASSSSALAASSSPLVPDAPASLVASLTRVCSSGYFSKCGGLK